jgi:hypothetical protein
MQKFAAILQGDSIEATPRAVQKVQQDELDLAATNIIQCLAQVMVDVSGDDASPFEQQETLLRITGPLCITGGVKIAEASQLTSSVTELARLGNSTTRRYMLSAMCQSLTNQRCREIMEVGGEDIDNIQLGRFAINSRRNDYKDLKAGLNLESALSYVRLKKDDMLNALAFIENNCDLSWRNGHTVSKRIGSVKIEFPRLKRHLTKSFLFQEYVRWTGDREIGAIGRQEFKSLLRMVTVEVREVTGASYYYTDGVLDAFKMISEMLTRLRMIAPVSNLEGSIVHVY